GAPGDGSLPGARAAADRSVPVRAGRGRVPGPRAGADHRGEAPAGSRGLKRETDLRDEILHRLRAFARGGRRDPAPVDSATEMDRKTVPPRPPLPRLDPAAALSMRENPPGPVTDPPGTPPVACQLPDSASGDGQVRPR